MKKLYLIFFILINLYAHDENLLKTLNEVNEIAFQTKLNIDKTPSNVTVLKRDFIQKTGAETLFELLKYIPGIQTSISSSGKKELIVRGNKSIYRDKIKFLINGISVTNNLYSNQFYYYDFPTSLIKRVEITLTPDAVTYGDNAFLGVINIITLDNLNDNQFTFYQNNKNQTLFSVFQKLNNLTLDAYCFYSDPHIQPVKTFLTEINTYNTVLYRENSPNENEKNLGLGIEYKKENSTLQYRINYSRKGNYFGIVNLPPIKDDKYVITIYQYLNYNYSVYLNDFWKNSVNIGIKNYKWDGEYRLFPYDFNETIDNNPDNDIIFGAVLHEYEIYLNNTLTFINESHITNFLFSIKYARPYNYYINEIYGNNFVLKKNIKRKIYEFGIEDLYFLNDKFSLIYGGRYSHYNHFGSNFSYKIGGVYNLNDLTTFKLLFNTAFRAPSWVELYSKSIVSFNGNTDLNPEKIKMAEFIYDQKLNKNNKFKFAFYFGKEYDYIDRAFSQTKGKEIYKNLGNLLIRGFEINYKKLFKKGLFGLSYSYNNNKALFSNMVIPGIDEFKCLGIRKNIFNTFLNYKINKNFDFFVSSFYGSKIKKIYYDYVNDLFTINANISFNKNKFIFKIGVDNITNHKNFDYSLPNDSIYGRYAFSQENTVIPELGRKIYFNFIKKW
ncbi:iron complex outermembrane recepter protein [Lebetimonas natsushimae]|uniref:Iron complex outermembrane recepter protein n=1 Tax=Lebetimonas natsushimae TaxID=1936991 RepID=A0A292YEP4_9BACT|nr:TonB-dependent receptor [Lebetimonas natsushimae]GAX87564.1 iron complex outermembrane recepter protein [Lebetimonas natsushimae]